MYMFLNNVTMLGYRRLLSCCMWASYATFADAKYVPTLYSATTFTTLELFKFLNSTNKRECTIN